MLLKINRSTGEKGFSLVEIIFTIAILAIGLLGIATVIPFGISAIDQSNLKTAATGYVNEGIELVKSTSYVDVLTANFPNEDYGMIPGGPDFSRTYDIQYATDSNGFTMALLKMVTVRVFWRTSDTQEQSVYGVTYVSFSR